MSCFVLDLWKPEDVRILSVTGAYRTGRFIEFGVVSVFLQ